ncbi:DUF4399 domain-containing protein [Arenimonas oryziterrae]|uniref:DUF4399 domain-containing protein n=1 Tax=Arenimonas oryziterrae DSM 21050 = YC6267 TaxID=1121015 RepID=A0A091AX78_9GAMM|nr:DUF4399 domain-containing protein [Arenimonas oryziterrae]KFN44893.1 hypothetical protein N789_02420 [Arenimonas oryziterrae DSM 21050 = YC6267]
MNRMSHRVLGLSLLSLALVGTAVADGLPRSPSAPDAEVYFISPKSGSVISGEVTIRFGLRGMGVAPAGTQVENTGHHHLIIDSPLPDLNQPIPMDDKHLHFGKGQTEVTLKLPAGKHTLQLVFADGSHVPHTPPLVSEQIRLTTVGH